MTATVGPVREQPTTSPSRTAVPWLTVIPLALVMDFADGFWAISLRGSVGAIERTQAPFSSWLRESSVLLPVFVLAVLGALILALRWFGPAPAGARPVLATGLLVVVAGTLAGTAWLAASAAYDYHLQAAQLAMRGAMHGRCAAECQAQQLHATLLLDERAVAYGSGILLVTNLVLVAWVVALRGGRLDVAAVPRHPTRAQGSRRDYLRPLLAAGLVGTALVHAAVVPEHLTEWAAAGAFFVVLTAAELAVAALLLARRHPTGLLAAAAVSVVPLVVWCCSRTFGLPFGPEAGVPEPVRLADSAACVLEIGTLVVSVILLRGSAWARARPPASTHVSRLVLVAVVAVTCLGVAATSLVPFDDFRGAGTHTALSPHP